MNEAESYKENINAVVNIQTRQDRDRTMCVHGWLQFTVEDRSNKLYPEGNF